jgi:hypothetical protein
MTLFSDINEKRECIVAKVTMSVILRDGIVKINQGAKDRPYWIISSRRKTW